MEEITLTKDELNKVFDAWYAEHGEQPSDFTEYENPKQPSETFLNYLKSIRNE